MNAREPIVRIAARGDGVTASGRHAARGLPGDVLREDGSLEEGPHHVEPPCRHFSARGGAGCGGCELQHADEAALRTFVEQRVRGAAEGQAIDAREWLDAHLSPANSRRRATLHAMRTAGAAVIGFREAGSHRIVDMRECHVLEPTLTALVAPLRDFVAEHGPRGGVDLTLATCDQGVDVGLVRFPLEGLAATEAALGFAREHALARLTFDQGYGPETVWEPEPVTINLSGLPVALPPGAFLQATADAEARLTADASEWIDDAGIVADLFSGLGTFAFALARAGGTGCKVLAVEADRAAHLACTAAASHSGGRVIALHRDLFRNPLQVDELDRFDAVLLDPPRAGARAQVAEIAQSKVPRVVYVSCNPSSWARDAAQLTQTGMRLVKVRTVGQFRWSTHVELVSLFER
ncbi:class I SAM-dependent RNA methyltransferase [Erythrobacter sp.]|uniref:class I SAM-dependent RNA methyltransferase n=1 Tax=Erythrobacter sp. TaxID=1042 RepID=UPI002EAF0813|nr:class I SAM-dependent RNA methyltransferase [Erythrobacter sp.]